ncbi:MAG: hypothetical protein Kow0090_07390 [Myxococcota bacterium]
MSELIDAVVSAFPELGDYIEDPDVAALSIRATGQIFAQKGGVIQKISHSVEAAEHIRRISQRLKERGADPRDNQISAMEYADSAGNRVARIVDVPPPLASLSITKISSTAPNALSLSEEALGYDAFRWVSMNAAIQSGGIAVVSHSLLEREMFVEAFARRANVDRNTVLIGAYPRIYIGNDVPIYLWLDARGKEQRNYSELLTVASSLLPQNIAIVEMFPEQFAQAAQIAGARGTRFIMGIPFANSTAALNGLMNWSRNSWRSASDEKRAEAIEWFVKYIVSCDRLAGGQVVVSSIKSLKAQKDKLIATALFTATPSGLIATEAGKMELDKLNEAEEKRTSSSYKAATPVPPISAEPISKPVIKLPVEEPLPPQTTTSPKAAPPPAPAPKESQARTFSRAHYSSAPKKKLFASLIAEASSLESVPKAAPPARAKPPKAGVGKGDDSNPDITERYRPKGGNSNQKKDDEGDKSEHSREEIELDDSDFIEDEEAGDESAEKQKR